jgi:ABC-2 type transport system permease protein
MGHGLEERMTPSDLRQSVRSEAPFMAAWSAAVLALAVGCLLLYRPFVHWTPLLAFIRRLPTPIAAIFDLRGIATANGFVEATLFGLVVPIAFMSVAIGIGSRAFGHRRPESGTADRGDRGLDGRSLVLVGGGVFVVTLILILALEVAPAAGGVNVLGIQAVTAIAALALLALAVGFVGLLVARRTGRPALAAWVATAVAIGADAANGAAAAVPVLNPVRYLSPVYYAEAGHPLIHGVTGTHLAVLVAVVAGLAAAVAFGGRRRAPSASGIALDGPSR